MLDFHPFPSENTHGKYDKQKQIQRLYTNNSVDNNFF